MISAPFGMENRSSSRTSGSWPIACSGYSLIELVTVITIIAVLATLTIAAIGSARESARRMHAKMDLTQIIAAIDAYHAEYAVYPVSPDKKGSEVTFAIDNSDLFNTLRAIPEGANAERRLNPRGIVYLEIPSVHDAVKPKSGISHGCWYDPWGPQSGKPESGVYHVRIDAAETNRVTNPYPGGDPDEGEPVFEPTLNRGVIAWSLGKGGVQTYELRDQVISWN